MPRRSPQDDDDLTDADRRAIADIRRDLDREFGPLEPAAPLAPEPPRASPPMPKRSRPSAPMPRPRVLGRTPGATLFLLGALVGGTVGGVTGSTTALLWLLYADDRPARAPAVSTDRGTTVPRAPAAVREPRRDVAALESAVNGWLQATKAGDIETQMRFYPVRVPVYYTWRNVAREAVHAEKRRVFGAATRLEITTDTPTLELAGDGDTAVSRFRKRYHIEAPSGRRRGEVLQELRWARTPDGWRIISERDVEVLSPSASVGPDPAKRGGTIEPAR
jgi:ketosteroid isomerase-like protein